MTKATIGKPPRAPKVYKGCKSSASTSLTVRIQVISTSLMRKEVPLPKCRSMMKKLSNTVRARMLTHIMKRGSLDYQQNMWVMCMDDRNHIPYSDSIKDKIILGYFLGSTMSTIFSNAIRDMDRQDINSLILMIANL